MNPDLKRRLLLGAATALLATALPVRAETPTAPLRLILPVSVGSAVDTIMRATQGALSKALGGQPVVIDNLPGAGGITGTSALVKAVPDGLTLGVLSNNHVVHPSVYKKLPYDTYEDITPIAIGGSSPMVLVVHPKVPARNVKELAALLKARPDGYNYGSAGNGTIVHLAGELVVEEMGASARHIPYKGTGPQIADLLGGQVEMGVSALVVVQPHLRSGALRAIGVMSRERIAAAPDLPTLAEQGLPGAEAEGWFAIVGPARLPAAEVRRLHAAFSAAFNAPEVKEAMLRQGNQIRMSSPEEAGRFMRSEGARFGRLVKKIGLQLD